MPKTKKPAYPEELLVTRDDDGFGDGPSFAAHVNAGEIDKNVDEAAIYKLDRVVKIVRTVELV